MLKSEPTNQVKENDNDKPPSSVENFFKRMLPFNIVRTNGTRHLEFSKVEENSPINDGIESRLSDRDYEVENIRTGHKQKEQFHNGPHR